jgi:neutral ceramidase
MLRPSLVLGVTLLLIASLPPALVEAASLGWKAGVTTVKITPSESMWMAGYGARKKPSEGVASDLFCKALALEDEAGQRFVFVTCDLIGIPRGLRAGVEAGVGEKYQLPPESLLLNASHTHCGPEFRVTSAYIDSSDERQEQARRYGDDLQVKLIDLVGKAIDGLAPAKVEYVKARCGFAMNRRTPSETGVKNNPWSEGPVDHDVPVLKVSGDDGALRAVLFGYACHNTTLSFYQFCGDYAGFAQQYFEEKHPGTTALFLMGCGGDQNPYPRGEIELCRQHGRSLASAVDAALGSSPVRELKPTLAASLRKVTLEFAPPPPREILERDLKAPSKYVAIHARKLLDQLDKNGKIETLYETPVQIVRLGGLLTLVAYPGETVVDYSLNTKRNLAEDGIIWVAGYCNDVFGYIPSKRVLLEGGYEGGGAFQYGSFPGPFAADVEERLLKTVEQLRADVK